MSALPHHVEAFIEGAFLSASLSGTIGWQCLLCGAEERGFASITEAEAAGEKHETEA